MIDIADPNTDVLGIFEEFHEKYLKPFNRKFSFVALDYWIGDTYYAKPNNGTYGWTSIGPNGLSVSLQLLIIWEKSGLIKNRDKNDTILNSEYEFIDDSNISKRG